ncbi:hypothetical protein RJ639_018851 [Escallonia herrerae]|uniref:MADS-box domain-containing protein n=1 Tax=Escallonia herrerae TaxID=1293975 RepID=A0AA88VCP3_9ASTE|nr:hypothetical protein RJ639_018851 [Escallonia herrerae]
MAKKPSMGRQKIKIAKIKKNHLQVTFSKRRSGLFKKASELCTLCGVEIAIVVFSPAGKVFSFGRRNVEYIVDRFFTRNPRPNYNAFQLVETHQSASIRELNLQLTQLLNELEDEKKRGESLDFMRKDSQKRFWWEAPIEMLDLNEPEQLRDCMVELKKKVGNQTNSLLLEIKPPRMNTASSTIDIHTFGGYGNGFF